MSNLMLGIILGLWSGVAMVLDLSGLGIRTPIITGLLAGLCTGNVAMGLQVGSVMLINSLGFYTYGGATIPDFITGSIFGTVVGAKTGNVDAVMDGKIVAVRYKKQLALAFHPEMGEDLRIHQLFLETIS